jgi:lysophospholipase L1-like esterase
VTRRQAFLFPALLTILLLLATCAGLELAVRLVVDNGMQFDLEMWKYATQVKSASSDPELGHVHRPGRRARLMGVEVRTNSRGLRDREFSLERRPGVRRILMLGDSLTFGWGVPLEDTFSKRIEAMYRSDGLAAEVINSGVGNWNTIQQVRFFETEGVKYEPDIVVLNYFVNDAEPVPKSRNPSWLIRNCYACAFILGRMDSLHRLLLDGRSWDDYYLSLYDNGDGEGWRNAEKAIAQLTQLCRERGIKLVVASLPELHDVENYRFGSVTALVRATAERYGAVFVDLLPDIRRNSSSELWVTAPDPHPNSLAHQRLAEGLYRVLKRVE